MWLLQCAVKNVKSTQCSVKFAKNVTFALYKVSWSMFVMCRTGMFLLLFQQLSKLQYSLLPTRDYIYVEDSQERDTYMVPPHITICSLGMDSFKVGRRLHNLHALHFAIKDSREGPVIAVRGCRWLRPCSTMHSWLFHTTLNHIVGSIAQCAFGWRN